MELVLSSKLTENFSLPNSRYYSVYTLKIKTKDNAELTDATPGSQFSDQSSTINKDFTLSMISNNLPVLNESKLRECFAKKIEKGTFYASANGYISTFDLGFKKDDEDSISSICYHNYFRQAGSTSNHYLVCFVLADGSNNLDLFRNELDFYCDARLKEILNADEPIVSNQLLVNWFDNAIAHLHRVIELIKANISILIEGAFSCCSIEFEGLTESDRSDISLFVRSFDCSQFIKSPTSEVAGKITPDDCQDEKCQPETKLKIKATDESGLVISQMVSSQFSSECAQALIDDYNSKRDLFSTKQIIEVYKLKFIHDLNKFNRYLRKGKSHYYDLFKAVLHLKYSKSSEILIKIYRNFETKEMSVAMKSFDVVVDFYNNIDPGDEENSTKSPAKQKDLEQSRSLLDRFSKKFPVYV